MAYSLRVSLPLAAVVLSVAAAAAPSLADACSSPGLEPAEPDPSLTDDVPPTAIGEVDVTIHRGRAPDCRLGSCSSTSCDDIGSIVLDFEPATDDQTETDRMAFIIEVVDGEPIDTLPEGAFRSFRGDNISIQWADGATDDQEEIEFSIVIRAVDEAGNVGPASEVIEIADPGGTASGCRLGGGGYGAGALLLLAPWMAWARRRRR